MNVSVDNQPTISSASEISEAFFMQNPPQYALLDLFYYRSFF